jgi:peptidoglycan/LPS O-acetylase OafA/YrhL
MWTRVAYTILFASMMWCFALGFLGWFTRFFKQSCPWVRYVADASYWVYLVHLPLVVALQVAVGRVALPWPVKYAIILGVAIPLLFGSYHYLVRCTFIGAQLNGHRYPLKWPWQAGGPNA